jgi:hypothetical protein
MKISLRSKFQIPNPNYKQTPNHKLQIPNETAAPGLVLAI